MADLSTNLINNTPVEYKLSPQETADLSAVAERALAVLGLKPSTSEDPNAVVDLQRPQNLLERDFSWYTINLSIDADPISEKLSPEAKAKRTFIYTLMLKGIYAYTGCQNGDAYGQHLTDVTQRAHSILLGKHAYLEAIRTEKEAVRKILGDMVEAKISSEELDQIYLQFISTPGSWERFHQLLARLFPYAKLLVEKTCSEVCMLFAISAMPTLLHIGLTSSDSPKDAEINRTMVRDLHNASFNAIIKREIKGPRLDFLYKLEDMAYEPHFSEKLVTEICCSYLDAACKFAGKSTLQGKTGLVEFESPIHQLLVHRTELPEEIRLQKATFEWSDAVEIGFGSTTLYKMLQAHRFEIVKLLNDPHSNESALAEHINRDVDKKCAALAQRTLQLQELINSK